MSTQFDQAYEYLINELIEDRLRPGELIKRREVAEKLGMSVSPVGEAMLQLEMEGLLETIPRKGTRVRHPSQRDVWGLLLTRIAIECQIARMVCGEPVRQRYSELVDLARAVDEAPAMGPVLIRADVLFHRTLAQMAGCAPLLWHFDCLIRQGFLLLRAVSAPPHRRESHLSLLEELASDDAETAERAMRAHIQHGKSALALERGLYEGDERLLRLGRSPLNTRQRMGRSMQILMGGSA